MLFIQTKLNPAKRLHELIWSKISVGGLKLVSVLNLFEEKMEIRSS